MNLDEKKILYNLIVKEIEKVNMEVIEIKKLINKEKKLLCKFEDGTTELVNADNVVIVTDPEVIAKALERIK